MGKKPSGLKKKPNFNNLKKARAECREMALSKRAWSWPLCWNKYTGYYCPQYQQGNADYLCSVDKSGAITCVNKEVQRVHNFKNYINPPWFDFNHTRYYG